MPFETRLTLDQPARYQIVVQGKLPENWTDFFGEMTPAVCINEDGYATTTLSGQVVDQSSLHGMLRRIRDLGLPLLDVKFCPDTQSPEGEKIMSGSRSFNSIFNLACKGVALGTSVAAIVLRSLKTASGDTLISLLAIGLAALALSGLRKE